MNLCHGELPNGWASESDDVLHLDQKGLELAAKRINAVRVTRRHQRGDVCQHIAKGGVKDHPVDGALAEGIREGECH
jgi:hypothetical protein